MSNVDTLSIGSGQQSDAAAAVNGPVRVGGTFNTTPPTLATGQALSLQLDTNGNLLVKVINGINSGTAGAPSANVLSVQGEAGMTPVQTLVSQVTSGGSQYSNTLAPATPAVTTVKSSAGSVVAIRVLNLSASPVYLKMFDVSGSITLGSTVANYQFPVPGSTAGAGISIPLGELRSHANSIKFAVTGGIAYTDSTAIAGNAVIVDVSYN